MTNVLHEQPLLNDTALTYNVCLLCLLLAYYLFASLNITFRIIGGLFYFFCSGFPSWCICPKICINVKMFY